jgi:hypothetical protein
MEMRDRDGSLSGEIGRLKSIGRFLSNQGTCSMNGMDVMS